MDYTVVSGDTLFAISQKFHITLEALQAANPGVDPDTLQVGQVLHIPSNNSSSKYTIQAGDNLSSIADALGFTLEAIEAANPGIKPDKLQVGQVINLPPRIHSPPSGPPPPVPSGKPNGYVLYSGPASNFPDPKLWASYDTLWSWNAQLMKFNDNDDEIADIKKSIDQVSKESGVDPRVILCMIMQESGGNVRVDATNNGVHNPGIMQSHNGVSFDPKDPAGSILQMIRDGTEGTTHGNGIKQEVARRRDIYSALRAYNSGRVNPDDLNDSFGAVDIYVQMTANRLMGHIWDSM